MAKAYSYIRFSTPEQLKGDSLRRQLEATEKYCKSKNLTLDTSLQLQDLGISAYHGAHKEKGALGVFLQLVHDGKIPEGSILIVENLDRLSREQVLDALNQFMNIIQAGIKIVTLQDGQEYDKRGVQDNWAKLIISITYMARAHEESQTKSKRLKMAWEQKRKLAAEGKIITKKVPEWISIENGKFKLIPEVCKVIDLIYRKKLSGKGAALIAKELNTTKGIWSPAKGKRNKTGGWRKSYIVKLLWNNRALIGEYQMYEMINGKRVLVGEPIPNYYPAAIDKDLFNSVQGQIQANHKLNGNAGGRTGKARNVFTHVATCGLCGSPMHFVDKGNTSKGGQYLHCDSAQRKLGCDAKRVRYDELLKFFIKDFDELKVSDLLPNSEDAKTETLQLENKIGSISFEITEVERKKANLLSSIEVEDDTKLSQALRNRYKELNESQKVLKSKVLDLQNRYNSLTSRNIDMQADIDSIKALFKLIDYKNDSDTAISARIKLNNQIRRICKSVKIYPSQGELPESDEIGIERWYDSRFIKKITIQFNDCKNLRILNFQGYSEIMK